MQFLFVIADSAREWNCSEWRIAIPVRTLNNHSEHKAEGIRYEQFGDFENSATQDTVMEADLVIFQRNLFCEPYFSAIQYFQGLGKPIMLDLDDGYPILPWSNPAHAFWVENVRKLNPPPLEGLKHGASIVDAVCSPSKVICQDWASTNMAVWVPNFPQGSWYEDLPGKPEAHKDRIVIGWGGSVSHYDSFWFAGVRQALTRICKRHPEVLVKICGNDGRIFLQLPVPTNQKMWQRGVPPTLWAKMVSTFDIGIAPLNLSGPYDARRSWIKGIEYMLAGVPWIYSDGPPYADIREHGLGVINTPDAWENAFEHMIINIDAFREKAKGAPLKFGQSVTMENNCDFFEKLAVKMGGIRQSSGGLPGMIELTERPKRPIYELGDIIHVG